jgi:hypothetical protein
VNAVLTLGDGFYHPLIHNTPTSCQMSNISIKSEKSDSSQVSKGMEVGHQPPYHKQRLHELFALIDKEFDVLYEENQECM